jgi:protein associated with RNAse G/E
MVVRYMKHARTVLSKDVHSDPGPRLTRIKNLLTTAILVENSKKHVFTREKSCAKFAGHERYRYISAFRRPGHAYCSSGKCRFRHKPAIFYFTLKENKNIGAKN